MFKTLARNASGAVCRSHHRVGARSLRFLGTVPPINNASSSSTTPPPPPPPHSKKKRSLFMKLFWVGAASSAVTLSYFLYCVYDAAVFPTQKEVSPNKPRLVIIGSGWGSVGLLKNLDFENYNVTVISSRNYFLFTPLLPSTATGLIEHRSIMEPTRAILRQMRYSSTFIEGEATKVDPYSKKVSVKIGNGTHNGDDGLPSETIDVEYDKLVIGVGATTNCFGIKGVDEYGLYLKETEDAQKIRKRIVDCVEAASVPGLPAEERRRLMHTVVVGAGPTGVEFAGELHDFIYNDVRRYNPEIIKDFKVSLIEGMPQILPAGFNKQLVSYAIETLERERIDIMTQTMVTGADSSKVYAVRKLPQGKKQEIELPYGMFVWAGGTGVRPLIRDLFKTIPEQEKQRRGLKVDEFLRVKGVEDVWAVGDCADAGLAPTAQVAAQEGHYVGALLDRLAKIDGLKQLRTEVGSESEQKSIDRHLQRVSELPEFMYSHQGSLAYIGSDKALADLTWKGSTYSASGTLTYIFWRSAYLSMCFSLRNKLLVALDWTKVLLFGRDVSRE